MFSLLNTRFLNTKRRPASVTDREHDMHLLICTLAVISAVLAQYDHIRPGGDNLVEVNQKTGPQKGALGQGDIAPYP